MAWKGIYRSDNISFISVSDPDPGNPTKFSLRSLSQRQLAWARDRFTNIARAEYGIDQIVPKIDFRQMNYLIVQIGLIGWDNFLGGEDGETAISFKKEKMEIVGHNIEVASGEVMDLMPSELISELAVEVARISELSSNDRKSLTKPGVGGDGSATPDVPQVH